MKNDAISSKVVLAGIIAGIMGAISLALSRIMASILELPVALPGFMNFDFMMNYLLAEIGMTSIFGVLFAIMYSKTYDRIPGTGILKGLVFGLVIWLFSNINVASYLWIYWNYLTAIHYIYAGFFTLAPFGLVLGALYKK